MKGLSKLIKPSLIVLFFVFLPKNGGCAEGGGIHRTKTEPVSSVAYGADDVYGEIKLAFGLLGAPASGKGFMQRKIKEEIEEHKGIKCPNLPVVKISLEKNGGKEDLSIDTIRSSLIKMPVLVQLNLVIKTFYWLKRLCEIFPETYKHWFDEFTNDQFKLWSEVVDKSCKDKNVVFEIEKRTKNLLLKIDNEQYGENEAGKFLTEIKERCNKELTMPEKTYSTLMYLCRYVQYEQLFKGIHAQRVFYFDETGADFAPTEDRLKQLRREGYITILCLIQPPHIGINFMQNVYRIIEGSDGGRDSGGSIVWTYLKLDRMCLKKYQNISERTLEVTGEDDTILNRDVIAEICFANTRDNNEEINRGKYADVFLKVSKSNCTKTYRRIADSLSMLTTNDDIQHSNLYKELFDLLLLLQTEVYLVNVSWYNVDFLGDEKTNKSKFLEIAQDLVGKAAEVCKLFPEEVKDAYLVKAASPEKKIIFFEGRIKKNWDNACETYLKIRNKNRCNEVKVRIERIFAALKNAFIKLVSAVNKKGCKVSSDIENKTEFKLSESTA